MELTNNKMTDLYYTPAHSDPVITVLYRLLSVYVGLYILGISYYAANHYIVIWKMKIWENAPETQVIVELRNIIRKYNNIAELDTAESVISESIRLTKYCEPYRVECYRKGLKYRIKSLENV